MLRCVWIRIHSRPENAYSQWWSQYIVNTNMNHQDSLEFWVTEHQWFGQWIFLEVAHIDLYHQGGAALQLRQTSTCTTVRILELSVDLSISFSLSWLQQKRRCLLLSITNRETLQGSCSPVSKKQFRTVCQCCIVHKSLRSRYSWSPESKISFTLSSSSSSLPLFLFILFVPLIVFLFLSQRARARARALRRALR